MRAFYTKTKEPNVLGKPPLVQVPKRTLNSVHYSPQISNQIH